MGLKGLLVDNCLIYSRSVTTGDIGNSVETLTLKYNLPCRCVPLSGSKSNFAGKLQIKSTHRLFIMPVNEYILKSDDVVYVVLEDAWFNIQWINKCRNATKIHHYEIALEKIEEQIIENDEDVGSTSSSSSIDSSSSSIDSSSSSIDSSSSSESSGDLNDAGYCVTGQALVNGSYAHTWTYFNDAPVYKKIGGATRYLYVSKNSIGKYWCIYSTIQDNATIFATQLPNYNLRTPTDGAWTISIIVTDGLC